MDMLSTFKRDFIWLLPLSLGLGAVLSFIQPGTWLFGWLEFSFLFLLCFLLLTVSAQWAGGASTTLSVNKILAWMLAIAFALRFFGGVATYLALPVDGFADEDTRMGRRE